MSVAEFEATSFTANTRIADSPSTGHLYSQIPQPVHNRSFTCGWNSPGPVCRSSIAPYSAGQASRHITHLSPPVQGKHRERSITARPILIVFFLFTGRYILDVFGLIGCNSIDRNTENKPQHSYRTFTCFHTYSLKLRYSSVSAEALFFR